VSSRKTADIRGALERKGFEAANRDHVFLFLFVDGRKTQVRTKISHGTKEYGDGLLSLMAKQLHLNMSELGELLDCPLSRESYVSLLMERGVLVL